MKEEIKKLKRYSYWLNPLLLTILIVLLVSVAIIPLVDSLKAGIDKFSRQRTQKIEAADYKTGLLALKQRNKELTEEVGRIKLGLNREGRTSSLYTLLNESAAASGIRFENLKPETEEETKETLRIPFTITMKGRYHAIGNFLNTLERSGFIVKIDRLVFSSKGSGVIDAQVGLSFYVTE